MVDDGVYSDEVDVISESEQAINQSTLRKPAQPHKLKINPKFEILGIILKNFKNIKNFENLLSILTIFMSFYDRAFS